MHKKLNKIVNLLNNTMLNRKNTWYKYKKLYATLYTNIIRLKKLG